MPVGVRALRRIQLGRESTAGVAQAATALWRGAGTIEDTRNVVFPSEDVGYLPGVDRTYIPYSGGTVALDSVEATFEQFPYLLEMGVKSVGTGSSDSTGTGYVYTYALPTTAQNTVAPYTVEGGDNQQMELMEYAYADEIDLDFKAGEAVMMSGTLMGRQVTAATRYTAATISFDSTAKTIADSAGGLASFLTGQYIKVYGSSSNDGIYTIATGASTSPIVITQTPVTESAGSTITLDRWFSGSTAGVSIPTVETILASKGKLYLDAAGSTTSTQVSNTLLAGSLKIKTGITAVPTADGNIYFSFLKQVPPEILLDLTFEHNASSITEKGYWRTQTARKLQLIFQGNALTTAGSVYTYKTLAITLNGKWESFAALDDQDGNDIVKGTFRARYNSTAAALGSIVVVNQLSSLT